jgi:hypothetical protein
VFPQAELQLVGPHRHVFSFLLQNIIQFTANEGLVRIQYKCPVLIYVFPGMKLRGLVISKTEL